MLRLLLKKQLAEVFKNYFYNAKKNQMRSKAAVAGWFVFFILVMVGLLGGIFSMLAFSLCGSLCEVGMGWLYFLLMCGIAILLGAFGSVFNTYSGLYLSKDNDLLLSLPIPVRTIVTARLLNVYVMGAMYAATVLLPTLIVYWIVNGVTAAALICGLLLFLIVTVLVLLLSCLLGWVVARLSLKLKYKSIVTVFISLLFIGGYYFFYFKANSFIQDIIAHADSYGEKIRGAAYGLYLFGRIGEGDWPATAVFTAVTAVLLVLVWRLLTRSFLNIAAAGGSAARVSYTEKKAREKSAFGALVGKEIARFTSSSTYMLNCGLGVLLLPVSGVLLLFRGGEALTAVNDVLRNRPDSGAVIFCLALCLIAYMNDIAAPSVSLEGKSLWIPQSLPIEPRTVLRAKTAAQLILTVPPLLFAAVCTALVIEASWAIRLLTVLLPLVYAVFLALAGTFIGLRMPVLNWTNETAPIKQSGAVVIALFGSWLLSITLIVLYLVIGYKLGAALYMLLCAAVLAVASLLILKWLDTKGAAAFAAL